MNTCDLCNKSFKTIQGLFGHQRMKHSASFDQNSDQQSGSSAQNSERTTGESRSTSVQNNGVLNEAMKQAIIGELEHCLGQRLDTFEEAMGALVARAARHVHGDGCPECLLYAGAQHQHGGDCPLCQKLAQAVADEVQEKVNHDHGGDCEGCGEYGRVRELKGIQRAAAYYEDPDKMPGVRELRERRAIGEQIITITN